MNYRKILITPLLVGLTFCSLGQQLTGIWKGYFITKDRSHYKIEIQVKENNGELTGVTYSYLNTEYYGKATLTGHTDNKHLSISIQEIKTVEVRSAEGSTSCLMNYSLSYNRSGKEEFLEGRFTSQYETSGENFKKGGDCGGGTVFLRRVSVSDFYNEPFLSSTPASKKVFFNEVPPPKNKLTNTATASSSKPVSKPNTNTALKKPAGSNPSNPKPIQTAASSSSTEPGTTIGSPVVEVPSADLTSAPVLTQPAAPKIAPTPVNNNRQNELVKEIIVTTNQVNISIYDNGEIDGDTLSVFLNGKVVLSQKRLSTTPLQLGIKLDESRDVQELTFVADNLGRIPPNTALMIIDTGKQQQRLQVLSTDRKNAVFRFLFRPTP
ncbi:MAG: hypothetical protein FJ340_00685 [Sphingomonadales bacterium]|nr:hypothetical protein [Sphingomonadales bacterium]